MKRIAALIMTAVMMLALLAACGEKGETYPGQNNENFALDETFIINVADKDRYYVQCKVMLELADDQIVQALTEKGHRVHGIVNDAVRSRTLDQLNDPDEQAVILGEIVEKINASFNTNKVLLAFFTHFTVIRQ